MSEELAKLLQDCADKLKRIKNGTSKNQPSIDLLIKRIEAALTAQQEPVAILLFCPQCGEQHVDAPDEGKGWTNPPHRSHECQFCGWVWRPADVATTGVLKIKTQGKVDKSARPRYFATAADFEKATTPPSAQQEPVALKAKTLVVEGISYQQAKDMVDAVFESCIWHRRKTYPSEEIKAEYFDVATAPPSGVREGMLRAAEILSEYTNRCLTDCTDESHRSGRDLLNMLENDIRAEAEKLPQGVVVPVELLAELQVDLHNAVYSIDHCGDYHATKDGPFYSYVKGALARINAMLRAAKEGRS